MFKNSYSHRLKRDFYEKQNEKLGRKPQCKQSHNKIYERQLKIDKFEIYKQKKTYCVIEATIKCERMAHFVGHLAFCQIIICYFQLLFCNS